MQPVRELNHSAGSMWPLHRQRTGEGLGENRFLVLSGAIFIVLGSYPTFLHWACPIYKIFGIYCPGCGATRAVGELFKLNPVAALHQNALFLASPIALLGASFLKPKSIIWFRLYLLLIFGCVLAFVVIRNLPNSPLAPY